MTFSPSYLLRVFAVLALVAAVVLILIYGRSWWNEYTAPSARESAFEGVTLTTESGEPLALESTEGKPLIIVSWATWCPECLTALKVAAEAKDRLGDRISVIAVNRKEERQIINDYRSAYELPDQVTYSLDSTDRYFMNVDGISMPEVLVYDSKGALVRRYLDAPQPDEFESVLNPLLK